MQAHNENRKKAMLLRWTQAWRRANKKLRVNRVIKKRVAKKTGHIFKAFSGMSLDELQSRRAPDSDYKKSLRDASERKKEETKKPQKKQYEKTKQPVQTFNKIPKNIRMHRGMLR